MIRVAFQMPATPQWQAWLEKCRNARNQLVTSYTPGSSLTFLGPLYKAQQQAYFEAFRGKCAYCETLFIVDQHGDIDHFRPKGRVSDAGHQIIRLPSGHPHPGYFWLAYDWTNLLPACVKCNQRSRGPDGRIYGKLDRFPVIGAHVSDPDVDIDTLERPLLLHPLKDDPADHLRMDIGTGLLSWRSERGRATIEILGLNRERLPEMRRTTYENVLARIAELRKAVDDGDTPTIRRDLRHLQEQTNGTAPYSFAGRRAIADREKELRALRRAR
jgi:uncharacterized protein (TIGR02646 family)